MSRFALFFLLFVCAPAFAADWSVLIYAQTDEEDLSAVAGPIFQDLLDTPTGASVEVIMEHDDLGDDGVARYVRRANGPLETTRIPERNSASPEAVADFLEWSGAEATGQFKLLLIVTHAWNWRHIFDDYNVPGYPDTNSKMTLPDFGKVLRGSGWKYDVLYLDTCGLGVAEALQETGDSARYVVASQLGSPMIGFPYYRILEAIESSSPEPRDLAALLPRLYVEAHARGGELAKEAGAYSLVTLSAVDTELWKSFSVAFQGLTKLLGAAGLRKQLDRVAGWSREFADTGSSVDLLEFLRRVPGFAPSLDVARVAGDLARSIGYPDTISRATSASLRFDPRQDDYYRAWIEGDELVAPQNALKNMKDEWFVANAGLFFPNEVEFSLSEENGASRRWLLVEGRIEEPFVMRPWLPGTKNVVVESRDLKGHWSRRALSRVQDYFYTDDFPGTSFLVAEAHTHGAPYLHGVGLYLDPNLGDVDAYESTLWSRMTGWGRLIFRQ